MSASPSFRLRPATSHDVPAIRASRMNPFSIYGQAQTTYSCLSLVPAVHLIKELALYEKAPEKVLATEESLTRTLFGEKPYAEVVLAIDGSAAQGGEAIGMALFVRPCPQARQGLQLTMTRFPVP